MNMSDDRYHAYIADEALRLGREIGHTAQHRIDDLTRQLAQKDQQLAVRDQAIVSLQSQVSTQKDHIEKLTTYLGQQQQIIAEQGETIGVWKALAPKTEAV